MQTKGLHHFLSVKMVLNLFSSGHSHSYALLFHETRPMWIFISDLH